MAATTGKIYHPSRMLAMACIAMFGLAACSLPEPDGTEADIIARAEGLDQITPIQERSAKAIVHNGLLLDPALRTAASEVSASADEVRVQRAAIFPSLGLSIGAGAGDAGRSDDSIDLQGRQLLLDFGATKRAVTLADIDLQIEYLAFQDTVDDAIFDLLEAYDNVRKLVDLLDLRREQLNRMTQLQSLVVRQTEIGAVPASDILETRKRLYDAGFLVHDNELALAEARARLEQLTGQKRGGQIAHLGDAACKATETANDVRRAQLELARKEMELEQAEKARAPRVYVEPIARQSLEGEGVSVGVNVGVNSDLLQGGALSARVNAARNARDGADAAIATARRDLVFDVTSNRREIAGAQLKSRMLNGQIALLAETRDLYRSQYFDLGTREVSDLLDNEEEYYDLKAQLIEQESNLNLNKLACAVRDGVIRDRIGLQNSSLYGYPLNES